MNEDVLFEVTLFDPDNTLIAMFEKQNIEFRKVPALRKFVVATDETIAIVSSDNDNSLIDNLALIFMEWLKQKLYRKLQVQLIDGGIVYIDKFDCESVTNILKNALKVTAFDPEYNNRILNK